MSTSATTVTTKGQVTIPVEIREHLGIKPKDRVRFEVAGDGSVRVVPAPSRLVAVFASITPSETQGNDTSVRREFEEGVAEAVLSRDTK